MSFKKLTEEEIEKIVSSARASVEMEGLEPSEFSLEIAKKVLRGQLTRDKATELVVKEILS